MFGQRKFSDRMSQLRYPSSEGTARHARAYGLPSHQHGSHDFQMQQRDPQPGYVMQQQHGYVGDAMHQPNQFSQQAHQRHGMHQQHHGPVMPEPNFRGYRNEIPPRFRNGAPHHGAMAAHQQQHHHHQASGYNSEVNPDFEQRSHFESVFPDWASRAKALREIAAKRSLFPHGQPFAEDYLHEWEQRPECPRPKWDIPEGPTWQPPFTPPFADYSGTELILVQEMIKEEALRGKSSTKVSTEFYKFDWQTSSPLPPSMDPASECNSDSLSVKSSSSGFSLFSN